MIDKENALSVKIKFLGIYSLIDEEVDDNEAQKFECVSI